MANTKRDIGGTKLTITCNDIEFEIVKQALRAYRHKLIGELSDLLEVDADENNPDVANTREWIDRTAQLKSDLGDF